MREWTHELNSTTEEENKAVAYQRHQPDNKEND